MNGNIWSSQENKKVNRNCSFLTLVVTPKRNPLESFKSIATKIRIKEKILKYYILEMSLNLIENITCV